MRPDSFATSPVHQRGAALIVALVMMVILTLIGVVAMNSSSIELIMAGNVQLEARATASAERTLAQAETVADGLSGQTTFSEVGIYSRANELNGQSLDVRGMAWNGTNSEYADDDSNRYVIEYLGVYPVDATGIKLGGGYSGKGGLSEVNVFRITSRSEDAKGAVRMLQSIFVKAVSFL